MLRRRTFIAQGVGILAWPGLAHGRAPEPKRLALVIGNNGYSPKVGALKNAISDANLVAQALVYCGFELTNGGVVEDAGRRSLTKAFSSYVQMLDNGGSGSIGFVYYAGHGASDMYGRNFIFPADIAALDEATWSSSLELSWIFELLGTVEASHIVSLDACRSTLKLGENAPINRGYRGLRAVGAGSSAFISYATWEGEAALDGDPANSSNGPYALALAAGLKDGPKDILSVFDDVRVDVCVRTDNAQEPMNISRLRGEARHFEFSMIVPAGQPTIAEGRASKARAALSQALCIGCSYAGTRLALANTASDIGKTANALNQSGFVVAQKINPGRDELLNEIANFSHSLEETLGEGVGLLYFSGFTLSSDGESYLIPADVELEHPFQLEAMGISLDEIVDRLAISGARAIVIILDSFRKWPDELGYFPNSSNLVLKSENVLLASSAIPGTFALDGPLGSYFTESFCEEIVASDRRSLFEVFMAVNERVQVLTSGSQRAHFSNTIGVPIYFRDGKGLSDGLD